MNISDNSNLINNKDSLINNNNINQNYNDQFVTTQNISNVYLINTNDSLNINNDLSLYDKIIPCGIRDKKITSLEKIGKKNYKSHVYLQLQRYS